MRQSPSTTWEPLTLPEAQGAVVWVWFRPSHVPDGLIFNVPAETHQLNLPPQALSLRRLLQLAGIDTVAVAQWIVAGTAYESQGGTSPWLDQPIPPVPAGVDPTIVVRLAASPASQVAPVFPNEAAGDQAATFDRIDADWQAALILEKQVTHVRRQLGDIVGRLNSLNRDLSPEERLHADRKDKTDWQNARRWLRDMSIRVAKVIKDQDIGDTSNAGKRNWFEDIYTRQIVPRQPVDGLDQIRREFESYRKSLQFLLTSMTNAHTNAVQDGERRAQQILQRISASVRSSKAKR